MSDELFHQKAFKRVHRELDGYENSKVAADRARENVDAVQKAVVELKKDEESYKKDIKAAKKEVKRAKKELKLANDSLESQARRWEKKKKSKKRARQVATWEEKQQLAEHLLSTAEQNLSDLKARLEASEARIQQAEIDFNKAVSSLLAAEKALESAKRRATNEATALLVSAQGTRRLPFIQLQEVGHTRTASFVEKVTGFHVEWGVSWSIPSVDQDHLNKAGVTLGLDVSMWNTLNPKGLENSDDGHPLARLSSRFLKP